MTALPDQPRSPAAPRRRRPKDIGTATETAVVNYLREHGWPHAERRALAGTHDLGDIIGTPGICWEIKGGKAAETAGDGQVAGWLAETERERWNAQADFGVLVMKRKACGTASVGRWWAVMQASDLAVVVRLGAGFGPSACSVVATPVRLHLADAVTLLRAAGYGTPEVTR
jgi:hypothetical protein